MTKDELITQIQAIGSCENEADRREMLTQLQENCTTDYDRFATLEKTNNQLSSDNENLRSANMKLFLRIGSNKPEDKPNDGDDPAPKNLKYEDLFDEKGELK